jgi:ABC-type Fe3+ transport system substrate-binding protein
MEVNNFRITAYLIIIGFWIGTFASFAAAQTSSLPLAKQQAGAKGYVFFNSHDEIVDRAKKEGKLRVFCEQDPGAMKAMVSAFNKKYPFIEVKIQRVDGEAMFQRMLQEMHAGLAKEWDVNYLQWDFYTEFLPHQKKFDMLGMAEQGVLQMPVRMIDPVHRHVVALESNMQVLAYNKEVISKEKVPDTLEDFLKPEFKGRKFGLDVRSKALPALVPLWGLEKVLDITRKLAAQDPIWFRGDSRTLPLVSIGEIPLAYGLNYKSVKRHQEKDVKKLIEYKVTEPVPARLTEGQAVLGVAANPHAGLLWLEFQAGPEGQKILDQEDLAASLLSPGSVHEQLTRGKKISIVGWNHFQKMEDYTKKIVEASGFPRADKK